MLGPHSVLTSLNGVGHASIEETTETGTRQTTSGDRLTAHFAASTPAARRGTSPEAQLQSATVEGHVVLTQTPAAKPGSPPQAPMHATAGRADYEGQGEWLHLTVNPRVEDGALQLTADKVDVSRASGDAFAHGNVKASWMDAGSASNGQQDKPAGRPGRRGIWAGRDRHMLSLPRRSCAMQSAERPARPPSAVMRGCGSRPIRWPRR